MFPAEKIRTVENLHIFLWLLKDMCWVLLLKIPGLVMIIPTVGVAAYLVIKSRHHTKELLFNLAVLCWILANSIWMIGEFFFDDSTRGYALLFFLLGIGLTCFYYARFYFYARK